MKAPFVHASNAAPATLAAAAAISLSVFALPGGGDQLGQFPPALVVDQAAARVAALESTSHVTASETPTAPRRPSAAVNVAEPATSAARRPVRQARARGPVAAPVPASGAETSSPIPTSPQVPAAQPPTQSRRPASHGHGRGGSRHSSTSVRPVGPAAAGKGSGKHAERPGGHGHGQSAASGPPPGHGDRQGGDAGKGHGGGSR